MSDLYALLGVSKSDVDRHDAAWLKKAYLRRAVAVHPDKPGGDTAQFQALQAAYEILAHADKRAAYDRDGWTDELRNDWTDLHTASGRVSEEELRAFQAAYVNSDEELGDLLRLYGECASLADLAAQMWFGSIDEEPRYQRVLELQIAAGNVEARRDFFRAERPVARQRRVRAAQEEAREAEEMLQQIRAKQQRQPQPQIRGTRKSASAAASSSDSSLVALIAARNQDRARAFDAFEAKWAARAAEEGDDDGEDDLVVGGDDDDGDDVPARKKPFARKRRGGKR